MRFCFSFRESGLTAPPGAPQVLEFTARQACVAMGVPAMSIGMENSHVSASVSQADVTLRHTLSRFRHMLSRSLMEVYTLLYGRRDGMVVVFPSLMTDAEAKDLFTRNVLTYQAYKEYVTQMYTVSPVNMEKRDPRLAEGQRPGK